MGLKRGRKELAEEWKAIRRGWYVGGTEFKERMLAVVEQPPRQGRGGSYSGAATRAHGEAEAERLGMLETNQGGRRPLLPAEAERAAEIGAAGIVC